MKNIIEISDLTCSYGRTEAVRGLTLQVPEGSTYAFLGTNGAGKTTTIKTLLNLLQPSGGTATVLGVSTKRLGPEELARIGYVSEDQKLPETLTLKEIFHYSRALYPTWDEAFCQRLLTILSLPLDRRVGKFSRGMKIKAALLISLAYRPRLLLLDEPFSGLDPLVRDELVQSMVELFKQENWTMFISSHDIDDVARLADWVGFLDEGKLRLSEPLENLLSRFRRIDVIAENNISPEQLPKDALLPEVAGATARWIESHFVDQDTTLAQIRNSFAAETRFAFTPLSLREIFVTVTRSNRLTPPALP